MNHIRIIPCLDVKAGRVVKGVQFTDLCDAGDPVECAKAYNDSGADELCFLDIAASIEQRSTLYDIVQRTAETCFMPLTVGGGVRSVDDVVKLLRCGADKVAINTAAVIDPSLISAAARAAGSQCIVAAIDARMVGSDGNGENSAPRWEIFTHGGMNSTGIDAIEYAKRAAEEGAGEILITSMDRDGTADGYDIALTEAIAEATNLPVIASGGAGGADHMVEVAKQAKCTGVLAASIFHFGHCSITDVKEAMLKASLPVRPPSC